MGYKIIRGYVKVIRPNDKPVIGVGDGIGKFIWVPTEDVLDYFPKPYVKWQETVFKLKDSCQKDWIEENKFDQYGANYGKYGKKLTMPIPATFLEQSSQQLDDFTNFSMPIDLEPQPVQTRAPQSKRGEGTQLLSEIKQELEYIKKVLTTMLRMKVMKRKPQVTSREIPTEHPEMRVIEERTGDVPEEELPELDWL